MFGKRSASPDGLSPKCKECQSTYDKSRAMNPKRVVARKEYSKTKEGKASGAKCKQKWIKNNPLKRNAQIIVGNAVRDGKLEKKPCEICGNTHRTNAHHDDYSDPLSVRWLCSKHHIEWHSKNGEGLNGETV